MSKPCKINQIARWVLVPCFGVVGFFAGVYTLLFLMFFPFPRPLMEPTAAFVAAFLVVFAPVIEAPSHRVIVGMIGFVLGGYAICSFLKGQLISVCMGGALALGLMACWFSPRRTARLILWVGRAIAAMLIAYVGVVYAFHKGCFARTSELPIQLAQSLGTNASQVTAFYNYDRSVFMNGEYLWRLDAPPEVMTQIITGLELLKTNTVPQKFWRLPPYYWPRSMPPGGEAFQSRLFTVDQGRDGNHYFLLFDKPHERAFVWVKSNM